MTPDQLIAARTALNLSRRDLASVLGVHWNTVTKWETGAQGMPPYLGLALDGIRLHRTFDQMFRDRLLSNVTNALGLTPPGNRDDNGSGSGKGT